MARNKLRATFGQGFYWAYSKCVEMEAYKSKKADSFKDRLKELYGSGKHALRPRSFDNLNEELEEFIESMRKFRKEIMEMNELLQNALISKKELLAKQGKELAKDATKGVAKKGGKALVTGGASLLTDAEDIVEDLLPQMIIIAGNMISEKGQAADFYAKRGLADHALILFTGYQMLSIVRTKFGDNQDDEYVKAYATLHFAIDTTLFGRRIRIGKVTTIAREAQNLDAALREYGRSIDSYLDENENQHAGLMVGSAPRSDDSEERHGNARLSVSYGHAQFRSIREDNSNDGDYLGWDEEEPQIELN